VERNIDSGLVSDRFFQLPLSISSTAVGIGAPVV